MANHIHMALTEKEAVLTIKEKGPTTEGSIGTEKTVEAGDLKE